MRLILSLVLLVSASVWANSECNLDGHYEEEGGFFSFDIVQDRLSTTGKVSYNGQTFYYTFREPLRYNPQYRACATTAYFSVPYRGAFGRVFYCQYPVTTYIRVKAQANEYINGTVRPSEIYPGPGCGMAGNTDSKYTMIRR